MDKLSFMFHFTETESFSVQAFHLLSKLNSFSLHFSFLIFFAFTFFLNFFFSFVTFFIIFFFNASFSFIGAYFPSYHSFSIYLSLYFLSSVLFTALLYFHNVFIYCWLNNLSPCLPFFFYLLRLVFHYPLHFFMLLFYPLSSVNTFLLPAIFDFILFFSFQYNNLYNGQLKRIHIKQKEKEIG